MRVSFSLSLLLIAGPVFADSLSGVCGQLIGSQVSQCMAAGNGRYISPAAVEQCGKLIGSQVISCVGAIADKDYATDEANTCGGLIGSQVTDCLRRTGRPHSVGRPSGPAPLPQGPAPSNAEIRAEIAAAIELIRSNDPQAAEQRLRQLLHALR